MNGNHINTEMPTGIFDALQAAADAVKDDWEFVSDDSNYRKMVECLYLAIGHAWTFARYWDDREAARAMEDATSQIAPYID